MMQQLTPHQARWLTQCSTHPGYRAGWRCTVCDRALCPQCASEKRMPNVGSAISICVHCGGFAPPIVRRKRISNYLTSLPTFIGNLFTMEGMANLVGIGLVLFAANFFRPIKFAIFVTYMFHVIKTAASGSEKLPDPADFTSVWELVMPVIRYIVAMTYIWLPMAIFLYSAGIDWEAVLVDGPSAIPITPIPLIIIAAGILYFPIALIVAGISESVFSVLDLTIGFRILWRLPFQYLGAAALAYVFYGAGFLFSFGASTALSSIDYWVPWLFASYIVSIISLVFSLIPAWILGRFIYQNHEQFGLMLKGQGEELEWPDAVAIGQTSADGSVGRRPMDAGVVEGWEQPGLALAAGTASEVPPFARQIEPPRAGVEAIEVEGWSERRVPVGGEGGVFGSPPQPPPPYGAAAPPSPYGAAAPPSPYGAAAPPSPYGAAAPPSPYGAAAPPLPYGAAAPPPYDASAPTGAWPNSGEPDGQTESGLPAGAPPVLPSDELKLEPIAPMSDGPKTSGLELELEFVDDPRPSSIPLEPMAAAAQQVEANASANAPGPAGAFGSDARYRADAYGVRAPVGQTADPVAPAGSLPPGATLPSGPPPGMPMAHPDAKIYGLPIESGTAFARPEDASYGADGASVMLGPTAEPRVVADPGPPQDYEFSETDGRGFAPGAYDQGAHGLAPANASPSAPYQNDPYQGYGASAAPAAPGGSYSGAGYASGSMSAPGSAPDSAHDPALVYGPPLAAGGSYPGTHYGASAPTAEYGGTPGAAYGSPISPGHSAAGGPAAGGPAPGGPAAGGPAPGSVPPGAYSPAGSYPAGAYSPAGSYPAGSYPAGAYSPAGSYPAGSYPAGSGYSPQGAYPGYPGSVPPMPSGVPPGTPPAMHALQNALQNESGMVALTEYQRCLQAQVQMTLAPRFELRLAGVLERAREFEGAVAACRRAADQDLTGPYAPRAVFMAAQLYEHKLREPARAKALYQYLVDSFPGDALTQRAAEALRKMAAQLG